MRYFFDNPRTSDEKLLIALWPSPSEIYVSDEYDLYASGLAAFYSSREELEKSLLEHNVSFEWYTNEFLEEGEQVDRDSPPTIVEFFIWLGTAGMGSSLGIALYKALDLWVKKVNGRKIKVKFNDIEIETTQLTEKQFEKLLLKITESKRNLEQTDVKKNFSEYPIELDAGISKEELYLHELRWAAREDAIKRYLKTPEPSTNAESVNNDDVS